MRFYDRVSELPRLGLGISTEYGAQPAGGLDPLALREAHPEFVQFLEVGVEVSKGLDQGTQAWICSGYPTTYHFLDINLDESEDFDLRWRQEVAQQIDSLKPAWLCGDAGLWHFGPRDRNHMLLLPPILSEDSARELAHGVIALRESYGLEVLPENPPGTAFVGPMHILAYFSRLCELADTGMLLDVAHLAMFQQVQGLDPLDGLENFDARRVIEIHVAGGQMRENDAGFRFIEDSHGTEVLDSTWQIFQALLPRTKNLRAVVVEGERNQAAAIEPVFSRVANLLRTHHPGLSPQLNVKGEKG